MSHRLEEVGRSGRFVIYEVISTENASADLMSGSTGGSLDRTRIEARGQVTFERRDPVRTREKKAGEVRF